MALPTVSLMEAQAEFLADTTTPFIGLMGGYRAGKTYVACMKAIHLASLNVGYNGLMLEPTASLVDGVLVPQMRECLESVGFQEGKTYDCYTTSTNPKFILRFPTGTVTIFLRASENYQRIVGISVAWFVADEFDTSGYEICHQAWQKMVARLTKGNVIQGCITSTKEGFQWCYKYFVEEAEAMKAEGKEPDRRMIDILVKDNPYVDEGYIEKLRSQLSPKQFEAYVENKFINFTEGAVYYCYDRIQNRTIETLDKHPHAPLHIGIDFNVGKMAAVVAIVTGGKMLIIDEIFGTHNTMSLAEEILRRYPHKSIQLYVDSSGNAEKTNASHTDIQLLRFHFGDANVRAYKKHLLVVDRIGMVNTKFLAADRKTRELFVNDKTCPILAKCLEAQGYKDGKPDKANDLDHLPDALGYFVTYLYPPVSRIPTAKVVRG